MSLYVHVYVCTFMCNFHYLLCVQFDFDTRSLNSIQNGARINKSDFAQITGYSSEVSDSTDHSEHLVFCVGWIEAVYSV